MCYNVDRFNDYRFGEIGDLMLFIYCMTSYHYLLKGLCAFLGGSYLQ